MSFLTRKKTTPTGNPNLCRSCAWAQFMTGYGDREKLAVCTNTNPNMVIPFAMLECTSFSDRNRPDQGQARKPAFDPRPGRPAPRAGFAFVEPARPTRTMTNEDGVVPIRTRIN